MEAFPHPETDLRLPSRGVLPKLLDATQGALKECTFTVIIRVIRIRTRIMNHNLKGCLAAHMKDFGTLIKDLQSV